MASPLDAPSPDHLRTAYPDTAPTAPPLACGITRGRSSFGTRLDAITSRKSFPS